MARTMAYLNKLYVDTPVGADIFKVAGGGQNYVHGGTSLQEMIVPVIELTTNTRGVACDYVDVVLTSVVSLSSPPIEPLLSKINTSSVNSLFM